MLNILKNKPGRIFDTNVKIQNEKNKQSIDEYKNIIYYPSQKEWYNTVYSYNKTYIKNLVAFDIILNNLFKSYFNMLLNQIKVYKRRRSNKIRYSSNKIYVSKAEIKHTNNKLTVVLYTYNKQKSSIERSIRQLGNFTKINKYLKKQNKYIMTYTNRLVPTLKERFLLSKKWKNVFFKTTNSLLKYLVTSLKRKYLNTITIYSRIMSKKLFNLEQIYFNYTNLIIFNKSKFNHLFLNLRNLGLTTFIQKIYDKEIEIKVVELKSIHLNSDIFSYAVALKLRDRKNKAVSILKKAILQMVKIPDLHTLITFDDSIKNTNDHTNMNNRMGEIHNDSILKNIKQQVVSGVRFEARGRLTRRLTALRAIFKYRYIGSLKNIRSSLNKKSSTMLRGYVKSNSQYTIVESKTRNGSFGLKGWVSSH